MACLGESHKLCVLLDRNLFFPRFATDAAEDRIGRYFVVIPFNVSVLYLELVSEFSSAPLWL